MIEHKNYSKYHPLFLILVVSFTKEQSPLAENYYSEFLKVTKRMKRAIVHKN